MPEDDEDLKKAKLIMKRICRGSEKLYTENQILKKLAFNFVETAIASEKSLAKDWLSKEDEKAWKNL
ncbi:MAG: hypothetical protein Q8R15_00285 [Candidatus Micrarchaeota archaeon]|nr:hypothetical protein [Candidatus Micrarchaeota archaeon]